MIRIGLLSYYSSIYPGSTRDITDGFYAALPAEAAHYFQFVPEYVRQATTRYVVESVRKLLYFDQVDLVSGLLSYMSAPGVIPLIEKQKKMGFFIDMGEYIPSSTAISDSLFFNSLQYWQSQYALGYWAHKEFGDKGAIIMSLYDSGYHLHSAFRQGAISAGSKAIDYCVLHGDPRKSMVEGKVDLFFERMEKAFPSFIHAICCGSEAVEFLKAFAASGLAGKVPLLITAHMASEEILDQVANLRLQFYSSSVYNYHSEDPWNKKFKSAFEGRNGRKANVYALLGYEIGSVCLELYPYLTKRDFASVSRLLKSEVIRSPRNERSFSLTSPHAIPVIDIEKHELSGNKPYKVVVAQGKALPFNHEIYERIRRENVSGWQNPYLCV